MKFYSYLNEANTEDINAAIQKDCQPYLRLIKKINNNVFLRGMDDRREEFGVKKVRKDREPKGMYPWVFIKFNKWLQDNNHNRRDKSVSVNKHPDQLFGNRYYFFPIGRFSYSWVESLDINWPDSRTGWYDDAVEVYLNDPDNFDTSYGDKMRKPFADYFHTDEGISTAYKNEFEVWFNCKNYYYVSEDYYRWDNISKEIVKR